MIKAVDSSNGSEAWRQPNKPLKPTGKARSLALLCAATTWPAFNIGQVLQPQLLKLEEVFEETVKAGSQVPEEPKAAILLWRVGGQLNSYLNVTIGGGVKYLQRGRSQQKWSSSMLAASSDYQGPMSMEVDRVGDCPKGKGKEQGQKGKGKGKDATGNGKGEGNDQKGKDGDRKGMGKGKEKGKNAPACFTCGRPHGKRLLAKSQCEKCGQ